MNYEFFNSLQDRNVKDLYWLLFKPSPIKKCPEEFSIPLFPELVIESWRTSSEDYFKLLDQNPQDLKRFVDRKKNYRLGFYAESLLSYFFQSFSDIELLLQNFQVQEAKKTVGEIDFVIEWDNRIIHIELAVKYYLLLPQTDPLVAKNWIGPSRKDNLDKKLTKIQSHQLPLGKHDLLKRMLPKLGNGNIESFFLFRGQFFNHEAVECSFLNRTPLPYYFFGELKTSRIKKLLRRPNWLSSIDSTDHLNQNNNDTLEFNRPQMIKLSNNNVGFVVPDDWND